VKTATTDRGCYLNVFGLQGLSPALEKGEPRLARGKEVGGRCGWQEFFAAVERAGLALVWDDRDPEATSLVPKAQARDLLHQPSLGEGLERTRRFLRALRGPTDRAPPS